MHVINPLKNIHMVHSDTVKKRLQWTFGLFSVLLLSTSMLQAQNKPVITDSYIFFIDGANVLIPSLEGSTANDPLDPTSNNKVFAVKPGNWAESGFIWPEGGRDTSGINMAAVIGENYGESDTLYVRFLSDSSNVGKPVSISMFDSRTGLEYGTDDLPFRLLWQIPDNMSDNTWHSMAIPLPPLSRASLDSAKVGKKLDGSALDVEVDSLLLAQWQMPGAWANGQGVFSTEDPQYKNFDFEAVTKVGVFWDTDQNPGPVYFDYFAIGVPPSQLVDTPPSAVASVGVTNSNGENIVTWPALDGAGGYNVYFSESPITSISASGVQLLGAFAADATREQKHSISAPHPNLAANFTAHYAVTAKSPFGAESTPTQGSVTGELKVAENYGFEMTTEALDSFYGAIENGVMPTGAEVAAFFPDTYTPFTINQQRMYDAGGIENITGDDDLSGKLWVGFGATDKELVFYAEIQDDILVPALSNGTRDTGGAWNYDNYEVGIGNYSPESFIIGSTKPVIPSPAGSVGDDPDYQFRIGFFDNGEGPFVHDSWTLNGEVPFSQTIIDTSVAGQYRMLTILNTTYLTVDGADTPNEAFDFPTGDQVKTYPFNYTINDADATRARESQATWGPRTNSNWYNTPSQWEVIALVGKDAPVYTPTSVEDEEVLPKQVVLNQNYPNPFNPTTTISFTLPATSNVTLEVFNMLGQRVSTLAVNKTMAAGQHSVAFDAANMPSGMYLYRLSTGNFTSTKKMMLLK
jgi:hypothetical protein